MSKYIIAMYIHLPMEDAKTDSISILNERLLLGRHIDTLEQNYCIIVKDFSRFDQNSIETGYYIEQVFPLFCTRFIFVSDNFDTNDYKEDTGGMAVTFK